jgi:hypothetical protein
VKIFFGILYSSIPSRCPSQLILCPLIHFTMFSPLLISSSSRFVLIFHSPFSSLGPYIPLNICRKDLRHKNVLRNVCASSWNKYMLILFYTEHVQR